MSEGPVKPNLLARAKLWPWARIGSIAKWVAVLAIGGIVIYRLFVLPGELRQEAGEAKQDTRAATATVNTMQAGEEMMEDRERTIVRTQTIVKENTRDIMSAPGAQDRTPPAVRDAFVNSIERLRAVRPANDGDQRKGDPLP